MTDEDAFQAAIDAAPDDKLPRLVFCDYLDERNDPRAAGYRVIATFDRWPMDLTNRGDVSGHAFWVSTGEPDRRCVLFRPWWDAWKARCRADQGETAPFTVRDDLPYRYPTRRAAVDAAALAWNDLPPDRQTYCLFLLRYLPTPPPERKDRWYWEFLAEVHVLTGELPEDYDREVVMNDLRRRYPYSPELAAQEVARHSPYRKARPHGNE